MLVRLSLRLAAAAVSLSTAACSSLTRPDEVVIVAEAPAPALKQLPPMAGAAPAQPGAARAQPAPARPQPGANAACGD